MCTAEGDESVKSVELGSSKIRRVAVAAVGVASVIAALAVGAPAHAAPSSGLVINEVYGGGGNSGSVFTNDFIELANRGTTTVDVSGYSVQYHSS
jgi:phage-related minor tail protein